VGSGGRRVGVARRRRRLDRDRRVRDASGAISANWFNQPWLADRLVAGTEVRLRGRLSPHGFEVRSYDLGQARATADFAPVYRASEQVPSSRLRELVRSALELHGYDVLDPLPAETELPIRRDALAAIHFPEDLDEAETARRRLAFDELVALQLAVLRTRVEGEPGRPLPPPGELVARYRAALPFALTKHQEQAIAEIDGDLERNSRMQRLPRATSGRGRRSWRCMRSLRAVEAGRGGR
jgi:ATP-dependent DNA helicase RecG